MREDERVRYNPVRNCRQGRRGRILPGFIADGLTLVDLAAAAAAAAATERSSY